MTSPVVGCRIAVAVCGGIAAYKVASLVSQLVRLDAQVDVLMTEEAKRFVSALTFGALTHRAVHEDPWQLDNQGEIAHIALARSIDLLVVAPTTAHTLARLAHGLADDVVTLVALATPAPVLLAPAMDAGMYGHPVVTENITTLQQRGYHVVGPRSGRLASGLTGLGRLAEPDEIVAVVEALLHLRRDLAGVRIAVTAGGTQEPIDPVRFIGNRSSGKMGYAIAQAAAERGADVTLVSAPTSLPVPPQVTRVAIQTALELREALHGLLGQVDAIIQAAAVADYRVADPETTKIKRSGETLVLELVENPDIIAEVGALPQHPLLVGFAAETGAHLDEARAKLRRKGLDLIVFNDVSKQGSGFESDTNEVTLVPARGEPEVLPLLPKLDVAHRLLDRVRDMLQASARSVL
ncbi:MAG: bifunctional phosphopantothenoylcysteine decarboxylase/phosphopantothenate--cysteine ligase CoaBC [Chloroflexi bacterium]|nr:bifunctional phosphopantothenoylcysteine decarboxylase/phosphopantothenate--cysteine ligase CoaBC [Chloroflexota bacterium]